MVKPSDEKADMKASKPAAGVPKVPTNPVGAAWQLFQGAVKGAPGGRFLWWPAGILALVGIVLWLFKGQEWSVVGGIGIALLCVVALSFSFVVSYKVVKAPAPWIPGPFRVAANILVIGMVILLLAAALVLLLRFALPRLYERPPPPTPGAVIITEAVPVEDKLRLTVKFNVPSGLDKDEHELQLAVAEDPDFFILLNSIIVPPGAQDRRVPMELSLPKSSRVFARLTVLGKVDGLVLTRGPVAERNVRDR
jgi:hypothetical protein